MFKVVFYAVILGLQLFAANHPVQAVIPNCPAHATIDVTLNNGIRWEMCWEQLSDGGLQLTQISLTPRGGTPTLILGEASLAQVFISYDSDSVVEHLIGNGSVSLLPLGPAECPNGVLQNNAVGEAVVCIVVKPRGYAWRGADQQQGQTLLVYAVSTFGQNTFIHQWRFDDDGAIRPMLGVSGYFDAKHGGDADTGWPLDSGATRFISSRSVVAYWRLNFDIGGSADDVVEQFDYTGIGNVRTQTVTAITAETSRKLSPATQRFWRVKDSRISNGNGRSISYQVIPVSSAIFRGGETVTQNDLYVTQYQPCERYVTHNPALNGCAENVVNFVNAEIIADPVLWFGSAWHHIPRDEDEDIITTHWQGLVLIPRDFMTSSPLQ